MQIYNSLLSYIKSLNSAIVAFSGGVDSTLLLKITKDANIKALAVTIYSEFTDDDEIINAQDVANKLGISHKLRRISLMSYEKIVSNPKDRCYYCKRVIFEDLNNIAREMGFKSVIEGTNSDDTKQWRPGVKALKELQIVSPFLELNISKDEIRNLSKRLGLNTWDKPSSPCLATRFYYGSKITISYVEKVKKAEKWLKDRGFNDVRVRTDGIEANIEINKSQISKITEAQILTPLLENFREIGFKTLKLDLEGYISGKLDRE